MSAFVDTNVLVRHLTGDPPDMARRATAFLRTESRLLLADLVIAETVFVLESFYQAPREQIAEAMRSLLLLESVISVDPALLLRSLEVYETERLDFAEAYLVACAESSGIGKIASFDKSIDRVGTVSELKHMVEAGYSGTPLPRKLGMEEGSTLTLLNAPAGVLADLPPGLTVKRSAQGNADVVVAFLTEKAALERRIGVLEKMIFPDGGLWIAWPNGALESRRASTETSCARWRCRAGLVDNKICAIDATWTGLRLVWRRERRGVR